MATEFRKRQASVLDRTSAPRDGALRVVRRGRGPIQVVHESAIVHEAPTLRARLLARGLRLVAKPVLALLPFTDRTLAVIHRLDGLSARRPHSPHVESREYRLGGVHVEAMHHRYGPPSEMTVLYFHGGGFFSGSIETHRRVCERLALATGATVVSVDYVQLPDGVVADSVDDAVTAYGALLEETEHPGKVVVAGDSAGGYLAMKVAEIATRRGWERPAAIIGFSPLLSLDPERLDKGIERVSRMNDAYLPLRRIPVVRRRWLPEESAIEGCDSPLEAAELIDSPTFLVAVEDEILRPEVEAMAVQLSARGVEVETHLWRGQVHAFPVLADVLEESREAVRLAGRFARLAVGEDVAPEPDVTEQDHVTEEPIDAEVVPGSPVAPAQPAQPAPSRRRWWQFWRRTHAG
ncbi:alpha/beta hydrolase [Aeromicrobium sp. Leaf350]|uniref:alpha/beta hydrolase n=1 Tax=Aeromicrobium sp. Leaf350 TaxID=2876565 RepID=UPI001E57C9F1|nr:alpha/beta hydrolase fold domain-containing protein [Aeromicrobium sp. Leaf350]